jgi:hypothetical protein
VGGCRLSCEETNVESCVEGRSDKGKKGRGSSIV